MEDDGTILYTDMPLGEIISESGDRIELCPKCGKKGKAHHSRINLTVLHVAKIGGTKVCQEGCLILKFNGESK